ncbi:MAG TPA: hypothetical protein VFS43_16070 [Polyangiaceae bacterium]|nr:hypothetical protein [Polyangiaceae bacterium]
MTEAPRLPVTCPHYDPLPGARRCRHFLANGACDRPDELMCVEWLKANGPRGSAPLDVTAGAPGAPSADGNGPPAPSVQAAERTPADVEPRGRGLFGQAPPPSAPRARRLPAARPPAPAPPPPAPPPPALPAPLASADDVEALAARCREVRLETEDVGPLWLVAEPSGSGRPELTFRDAAALAAVCAAFPGARVTRLEWAKKST